MNENLITIGKIVNTQGHRGAVRVLPLTDFPERFAAMDRIRVTLKDGKKEFRIEPAQPYKKFIIMKFKEIPDMNAAETLKGGILQVPREELVALPEGNYYIFDIVGLTVYDSLGGRLGEVTDVLQTGSNDVYVVETGGKPLLVPALKQVVKEIDPAGRRMVVDLPEGLV
ncbi:MAG: ribosome maturation factor RimM [Firmicutes bacterium]|nr:ribosome maturation factor RimM [Bacillota bacterium]